MEPTFVGECERDYEKIGDRVITFKSAYLFHEPSYDDIVIIDHRVNRKRTIKDNILEASLLTSFFNDKNSHFWIKRVIGKAGDTIEYREGKVYRNGEELVEEYIKEDMWLSFETITVPDNHVFVMGDNRNGSEDSRNIGPIPIENVIGKVVLRYYPFDEIRSFN